MTKKVADMKLYDIMGVSIDVTQEDLKKAYKRKALQLHPDKRGNSPQAQEEFTKMKTAYDVLSDPQKRDIYDTMGPEGLKMYEDFGNLDAEEMSMIFVRSLSSTGPKGKCIMVSILFTLVGFLFLMPIFWCLRIDGTVNWDWAIVFIPVWVFDAIIFCCVGFSFASQDEESQQVRTVLPKGVKVLTRWNRAIKAILFILQQIFIVLHLDGTISWEFYKIFLPMFIFLALHLVEKVIATVVALRIISKAEPDIRINDLPPRSKVLVSLINSTVNTLLGAAFLILLALKLDGSITTSWWIMFLPVWIFGGFYIYTQIYAYMIDKKKSKQAKPPSPSHDTFANEDEQEVAYTSIGTVICHILLLGIVLSPFFIACARLQNESFSTFYILLPFFIVAGLLLCLFICGIFCVPKPGEEYEPDGNVYTTVSPPNDNPRESETIYTYASDPV